MKKAKYAKRGGFLNWKRKVVEDKRLIVPLYLPSDMSSSAHQHKPGDSSKKTRSTWVFDDEEEEGCRRRHQVKRKGGWVRQASARGSQVGKGKGGIHRVRANGRPKAKLVRRQGGGRLPSRSSQLSRTGKSVSLEDAGPGEVSMLKLEDNVRQIEALQPFPFTPELTRYAPYVDSQLEGASMWSRTDLKKTNKRGSFVLYFEKSLNLGMWVPCSEFFRCAKKRTLVQHEEGESIIPDAVPEKSTPLTIPQWASNVGHSYVQPAGQGIPKGQQTKALEWLKGASTFKDISVPAVPRRVSYWIQKMLRANGLARQLKQWKKEFTKRKILNRQKFLAEMKALREQGNSSQQGDSKGHTRSDSEKSTVGKQKKGTRKSEKGPAVENSIDFREPEEIEAEKLQNSTTTTSPNGRKSAQKKKVQKPKKKKKSRVQVESESQAASSTQTGTENEAVNHGVGVKSPDPTDSLASQTGTLTLVDNQLPSSKAEKSEQQGEDTNRNETHAKGRTEKKSTSTDLAEKKKVKNGRSVHKNKRVGTKSVQVDPVIDSQEILQEAADSVTLPTLMFRRMKVNRGASSEYDFKDIGDQAEQTGVGGGESAGSEEIPPEVVHDAINLEDNTGGEGNGASGSGKMGDVLGEGTSEQVGTGSEGTTGDNNTGRETIRDEDRTPPIGSWSMDADKTLGYN